MAIPKALTIAGSDTSGGAGIQADLKTFQELNVYGMTALTTIVTMNPEREWAHEVYPVPIPVLESQLKTVLDGIGVDAIKTGMLSSVEIIELVASRIGDHQHVVIDPVMVCKGADELLHPDVAYALRDLLVPKAYLVTPNLFEASQLAGTKAIQSVDEMKEAAVRIHERGAKYVAIKGGGKLAQDQEQAIDLLYDGQEFTIYTTPRVSTSNTHGAGCTYSAAITAELAKGATLSEAMDKAKQFITAAIRHGFPINQYVGPTLHAASRLYGGE